MQLYFIRHGQSENNLLYATTGSDNGRNSDPELTPNGKKQAKLLAQYLHREKIHFTHLYTSMMVRAVATGTVVAGDTGLPLVAWLDIHEEGGIYLADDRENRIGQPGKNRSYFIENYPTLVLPDSINPEGWWSRPFEARSDRPARAQRFLKDLHIRHGGTDDQVAIISHGGFYNLLLSAILAPSPLAPVWFQLNNTAITRIDFLYDRTEFVYQNRVNFLPGNLIT